MTQAGIHTTDRAAEAVEHASGTPVPTKVVQLTSVYAGGVIFVAVSVWGLVIPMTATAVSPVYREFGVALPVGASVVLSVPISLLMGFGIFAPTLSVLLIRVLLRGRAALWAMILTAAVVGFGGVILMGMLLLPMNGLVGSLSP